MAKIMLLENSAMDRMQIVSALEQDGHTLLEVPDGRDAAAKVAEDRPDCVVMELVILGMDGFKVIRSLRERGLSVPIIVQTHMGKETVRQKCIEIGANAFLRKPVNAFTLVETVKEMLSTREESRP